MVLRISLCALFFCFNVFANHVSHCPNGLVRRPEPSWESILQSVREGFFVGFRLQGTPSTLPLLQNSESGGLAFRKVAGRIALAEELWGIRKSQSFDGASKEHSGIFQSIRAGKLEGAGEYQEACRRNLALRRMGIFVSGVCAAGTLASAAAHEWALASLLLPQVFLSKIIADNLASMAERQLDESTEGKQIRQLGTHASLVEAPVAGAWAATGFNREVVEHEWATDTGTDPIVLVHTHFLDIFTWVDERSVPHTRILSYSAKSP